MKVIGIIPARYNSKRFPGKLLATLNGKSVIQHTYERAKKSKLLDDLIVATDDKRILDTVINFGGKSNFTKEYQSGTDRVADIILNMDCDIVINIQGDEPLIHLSMIDDLIKVMEKSRTIQIATVIKEIMDMEDYLDNNIVKVKISSNKYAQDFSRTIFYRYKHIGIYAYRKDFLLKLTKMPQSINEKKKSLEQMRILDNGYKIKCIETKYDTISIDTPEDLERIKNESS